MFRRWGLAVLALLALLLVPTPLLAAETSLSNEPLTQERSPAAAFLSLHATEGDGRGEVILTAHLEDGQGKAIQDALVKFFMEANFFVSGPMEIDDARTDSQGNATISFIPRTEGELKVTAQYEGNEIYEASEAGVTLQVGEGGVFYRPSIGLPIPAIGPELLIGRTESYALVGDMAAPATVPRLPGGIFSLLLAVAGIIAIIWGTYFVVVYQVLRISMEKGE